MNKILNKLKSIKKILLICACACIFYFFITAMNEGVLNNHHELKQYFIENAYRETGAKNMVTAIYLDYRLFDSVLEASILMITTAGLIFIRKQKN